ncbi:MAG: lipopolysaccharide heptosyltransferase II, partial [Verrucomicrobiota bacterium]
WRSFLLTSHFDRPKQLGPLHHQSQDYVDLFHHFGLLKSNEKQTLRALPKSHPPRIDSAYLLVCPGAEYGSAKRWPADHFAKAAAELARENSYRIVIAGGEGDLETAQQVERYLRGSSTINLTGSTTLSQFLTLCAHASFILCNDSGAMHTSSLYHTPGVALFGSTEPRWTGPLSPAMTVVQEDVPCSPCFLRECPIDFRCMRTLSVEMVLQACQDTLQRA